MSEPKRVAFGTVYELDGEIVVTGVPSDEEDVASPQYHNCDVMGCGLEHVLFRARLVRETP